MWIFIFSKIFNKIRLPLLFDKIQGRFTWKLKSLYYHILLNSLRMRNISDKMCRENQNTRFMFKSPPLPKSRLLWNNVENLGTARQTKYDNPIRGKHITWCTITLYVILMTSTKHAPHRPVSVYWKFQCRFSQVLHKTLLHIVARNCALPVPWHTHTHTHKLLHKKNRTKIIVLMLASWNSY